MCVVIATAVAAYLLLLRDDKNETSLHASTMTVEALYAAVGQRLRDAGGVTHIRTRSEFRGLYSAEVSGQSWTEPGPDRVREEVEVQVAGQTHRSVSLTTPEEQFSVSPNSRSESRVGSSKYLRCHGASVAASLLLTCPELGGETTQRVEKGMYEGRAVVVLVEEGRELDGERRIQFTSRLYLDAKTLEPIAQRTEGFYIGGTPLPFLSTTHYESAEVIKRDDLPPDFFEAAAIGYVAPDPLAAVRAVTDLQVYWLGEQLTLPDGDVLVLTGSYGAPGRGAPYRLSLQYARKATPHEPPIITLQVFHRDMWERSPIAIRSRILGDTVIFINEGTIDGQGAILSKPGNLDFLLESLQSFEP